VTFRGIHPGKGKLRMRINISEDVTFQALTVQSQFSKGQKESGPVLLLQLSSDAMLCLIASQPGANPGWLGWLEIEAVLLNHPLAPAGSYRQR